MKSKSIKILFLILILYFITSCTKDDIIKNEDDPIIVDSIQNYDWRFDYVGSGQVFMDFLVVDTSNIYIAARPEVLHYNGNTFTPLNLGFAFNANSLGSYDNTNIYIGGRYPNSPSYNKAVLVKYNNGSVDTYEVPYDSTVSTAYYLFESANKFWFTTVQGLDVNHFNNGNFKRYKLSQKSRSGFLYKDQANNIFIFAERIGESGLTNILDCHKYNSSSDSFELIFSEPMLESDVSMGLSVCGDQLISIGRHSFSYFTGISWVKYIDTRIPNTSYFFEPIQFEGKSKDSMIVYTYEGHNPLRKDGVFTYTPGRWNLEKWVSVFNFGTPLILADIKIYEDRIYGIFNNFSYTPYFLSGKKKIK